MFRRDLKRFLRCLIPSLLLLCGSLLLGAGAVRLLVREGNLYRPVKIAVVDEEDSVTSRILVRSVQNLDAFSSVLEAETMTEEEADAAFAKGDAAAVVILPDHFVDDVLSGRKGGGVIRLSSALTAQSQIVEAVARFGETLLAAGQYGVFSGETLIQEKDLGSSVHYTYLDLVNESLLDEAMNQSSVYFRTEIEDSGWDGLDLTKHYILCWFVLILFLSAVSFIPLYRGDASSSLVRRMASLGVGLKDFLCWKLVFTTGWRLLLIFGGMSALCFAGLGLSFGGRTVLGCIFLALYLAAAGACLSMCFGSGVAAVCFLAGGGLIFCGGIIPRPLLPRWLMKIGDLTPFGAARGLLLPTFSDTVGWGTVLLPALFWIAAAVLLLVIRWKNLVRGEEGV